jgi:glycosyltransferase involved in cell wall biosynthesis
MLSSWRAGCGRAVQRVRASMGALRFDAHPDGLFLVTGGGEWAVKEIALGLKPYLAGDYRDVTILDQVTQRPYLSRANIHCLCRPAFFKGSGLPPVHASNRLVVSWLHGSRTSEDPEMTAAFRQLERHWRRVGRFVVPNSVTLQNILESGVDPAIVHLIPNGVDLRAFAQARDRRHRDVFRSRLGIPAEAFVVGSFQRDEDDAGTPKMVKGPDILVRTLASVRRTTPVHALLTGPNRRYVRRELDKHGVPYTHAPRLSREEFPQAYEALDAYCVSSREEGGPATLRESMASGVPVVSTRVGLAVDMIEHGLNGLVVEVEDADGLANALVRLATEPALRTRLAAAALDTVQALDYSVIAGRLRDEVYRQAFA